jgi:hypothetical protein
LKAQDSTSNSKLDTLLLYQKKILSQQDKIYDEVVRYREPLENRNYGIEFNPAYFFVSNSRSYLVLSGGFSFFNVERHAEIACPFFYQSGTDENSGKHELTLWNQDIMYRKFLGQHQDGFYIEGGLRYTHIRGEEGGNGSLFGISLFPSSSAPIITTNKLGAMFGIGYRYFSTSGIYWGISFVWGSYISADERTIQGIIGDDTKTILDIEILKFGIAF